MLIPTLAVFCITAAVAWFLPARYESTVIIRIERTSIPHEQMGKDLSAFVNERLRAISYRVITREKLIEIIDRFGLYLDKRARAPLGEIAGMMRDDIRIVMVGMDVAATHEEQGGHAAIVFSVTYAGDSRETVQNVVDALAALYMNDDIRVRERERIKMREALDATLSDMRDKIAVAEDKVIQFRMENLEFMPEHAGANLRAMEEIDQRIEQAMEDERLLREREHNLQDKLDTVSHNNPLYDPLEKSLKAVRSKLNALDRVMQGLKKKSDALRLRIDNAPIAEKEYKALEAERDALQEEYFEQVSAAKAEAYAFELEKSKRGELYNIVEASRLPRRPISPNIPAILIAGLAVGLCTGAAFTAWRNSQDGSLRSLEQIASALPYPVFAAIPVLPAPGEVRRRKISRALIKGAILGMIVCLIVAGVLLWPK